MSPAAAAAPKTSTARRRRRAVEPAPPAVPTVAGHELVRAVSSRADLPRNAHPAWLDELARAREHGLGAWLVRDTGGLALLVTNPNVQPST